jgi:hypothetical protein
MCAMCFLTIVGPRLVWISALFAMSYRPGPTVVGATNGLFAFMPHLHEVTSCYFAVQVFAFDRSQAQT